MQINFQTKTILIVDDITTNRVLLSSLLEDEGYISIYEASSASEAYGILETHTIDLILLDVMMPEIDGVEACQYIHEDKSSSHIPIIMVTSDDSDETLTKSFNAGASDYVTKPINATNLKVRMASIFLNAHKDTIIQNQNRLLAVNETVQMLAHQWRQPLSTINSTILKLVLQNELDKLNKKDLAKDLETVTSHLQTLSKTLDEFRKITSKESQATSVDVDNLIQTSISLINARFQKNSIKISTNLQSKTETLLYQNELTNILINIYTNSLEAFTIKNEIKDKKLSISTLSTSESVTIVIEDNAGGINGDLLKNIFEPYVSSKYEKNGVGLGLYNAFITLKNLMNATIKIDSFNNSTIVSIVIPIKLTN